MPAHNLSSLSNAGKVKLPHDARSGEHYNVDRGEYVQSISIDPYAGGTYNNKPIWTPDEAGAYLNRTGYDWYTNNGDVLDDGILNFAFFNTQEDFFETGYINDTFTQAFSEYFDFQAMTPAQREAARLTLGLWDDLVSISFVETESIGDADIRYGNTDTGSASQAYAYLPFGTIYDDPEGGWSNLGDLGGDVWINKLLPNNFSPLGSSYYAHFTLLHETGHALGLSHPGNYNASDDDDGDGVPDPITYANDAEYAQDSQQYTIMSYFDGYETGAQYIDWTLMNFAYSSTPMVHDIAAIQAIYGADQTTRLGDTVYGFGSTADRDVYDFDINTRPILTIYDAGGNDTINFSGWDTDSVINLNAGMYSSGGGTEEFLSLEEINANRAALGFAARTQATYDLYNELFRDPQGLTNGLFKDNIAIAYGVTVENAVGGGGDDLIVANNVANRIEGGAGSDTVSYETATRGVIVNLGTVGGTSGGAAGDKLISIENLVGSAHNDIINGTRGANVIDGGSGGRDILIGGGGDDTISYAHATAGVSIDLDRSRAADDIISGFTHAVGSEFNDTITGNRDHNELSGGAGDDRIDGGKGNDVLNGGLGADTLTGDNGKDVFVFDSIDTARDVITDFKTKQDTIDLSGIDAIDGSFDDDAFAFIGSSAFSNVAGQLRFAGGILEGDVDGDGVADFSIQLQGRANLAIGDLIL